MSEKWWDMSDDELDDLFREASDKVDIPFDSLAYNKLRQRISEQPKSGVFEGFKKRGILSLVGLFLMVGVGLVYRFGTDSQKSNSTEIVKPSDSSVILSPQKANNNLRQPSVQTKIYEENLTDLSTKKSSTIEKKMVGSNRERLFVETQTVRMNTKTEQSFQNKQVSKKANTQANESKQEVEQLIGRIPEIGSQSKTDANLLPSTLDNKTATLVIPTNPEIANTVNQSRKSSSDITLGSSISINQQPTVSNRKRRNVFKNNEVISFDFTPDIKNQVKPNHSQALNNDENGQLSKTETFSEEIVEKTNFYEVDVLKNKNSTVLLTDLHPELPEYVDSLPKTIKPVKFSRFGLRIVLSPEMNSIENMNKMALGGALGLLVEYKISQKLSVQTGMVYSNKSYVGDFDYYHNWSDWKGYHPSKPTQVDGGCKIFDVPINLRFNLFQKPKQTWFISSGISSYWIINENYTYRYDWYSSRTADWNDNSKYYFGVMNFSVGLERQISQNFSFQIEPYLKTPLKYVGRGGVNLYSSGILFSTKYSF